MSSSAAALCLSSLVLLGLGISVASCGASDPVIVVPAPPPLAADGGPATALRPGAVRETMHGATVDDPFRYLEDEKSPETRAFVEKETGKLKAYLAAVPGRALLEKDIASVLHVGSVSPPAVRAVAPGKLRYFHTKREGTQNQPTLYVRDGVGSADRPLLEGAGLSADGTVSIDWWFPSWDGALVAWGRSESGNEESTLVIRDVATGKDLPDRISRTRHATVAWLPGGKAFFYSRYPAPGTVPPGDERYSPKIYKHVMGTEPDKDELVFGSVRDKTDVPQVAISPNGRWLIVHVHQGWSKNEVFLKDLKAGDRAIWTEVVVGTDALFQPIVRDEKLYILTNDGAPRYRLFAVDYPKPDRTHWKEVVPEGDDVLTDIGVSGDTIVATYLKDAAARVALLTLDGKPKRDVSLPGIGTARVSTPLTGGETFVEFVSYVMPPRVLRVDLKAKPGADAPTLWDQVARDFAAEGVTVARLSATSKDGTRIPMFVVGKEPLTKGPRPTLLWGYGGFNVNQTPGFSARALVMAKRGGVFVSAILRGGGELGEAWHRAGMLDKKQNVFDDFIACAEELHRQGITSPERLAIGGGSNGGLLTSVAVTQRPELFRAALSLVPLTDMVRYTRFQIAKLWIPEYGDPERASDFGWLHAYSPYHHVKERTGYPAVLFATAESDTRVDPMHARKMAARLQEAQASKEHPILLRVEAKAGHGAGKPVTKVLAQTTDEMSFVLRELGAL